MDIIHNGALYKLSFEFELNLKAMTMMMMTVMIMTIAMMTKTMTTMMKR